MPARKLLLVLPPCFLDRERDFEIGFPVHFALLAREARRLSWEVEYLDMALEEKEGFHSFLDLEQRLGDPAIQVVGISNHTMRTSITTRAVAERVKAMRSDVIVVVGGVNSTFMWRELLTCCPAIDYVLRGYGQPGLRSFLASLESGIDVSAPGLASRRHGEGNPVPMSPVTPEDFAPPSLVGLDVSRYLRWTKTYPLLTHTGCDFSCSFCTSVMPNPFQNKEVHRPIEDVIVEMNGAADLGFERFFMSANTFTSRRDRCLNLCAAIRHAGIHERATWTCMTRVDYIDPVLLGAIKAAGCTDIAFGVETAGASQWRSLHKGCFSEETIREAFDAARAIGLRTTAYLIMGVPTQTPRDIEATITLVRDLDPDYRVVSFFQPFPGTPFWESAASLGLSELEPAENWNFHEEPVCRTRHMDKAAIWTGALRLYLERSNFELPPPEVALVAVSPAARGYIHSSIERELIDLCDASITLAEALHSIVGTYGTRGRIIAVQWLSSALRLGIVGILDGRDVSSTVAPGFSFRATSEAFHV